MNMKIFSFLLILSMLIAACGPVADLIDQRQEEPADVLEQQVSIDDEVDLGALEFSDEPIISSLMIDNDIVEPGSTLIFSGHASLSGELTFSLQDEIIARTSFDQGYGELTIPTDAPDGRYLAIVETETGELAYRHVWVSSGPGIWLQTDRHFASERDMIELSVSSHGLPNDLAVFIGIGDIDWEDELFGWDDEFLFDDEDDDWFDRQEDGVTPPNLLVPMANGLLVPSHLPALSLGELSDLTLFLPGFMASRVQVIAFESNGWFDDLEWDDAGEDDWDSWDEDDWDGWDTDFEPVDYWVSDPIYLQVCDQFSQIQGDIGGSGWVQIWSLDGELISQSVFTEHGAFSFELKPGTTLVLAGISEDDEYLPEIYSQMVDIPCNSVVDVDIVKSNWTMRSMPAHSSPELSQSTEQLEGSGSIQPVAYMGANPFVPVSALQGQAGGGGGLICRQVAVSPLYFRGENLRLSMPVAAYLNQVLSRANVFSVEAARGMAAAGASVPQMDFEVINAHAPDRPVYHLGADARRSSDAIVHVYGESPSPLVISQYIMEELVPQLASRMADSAMCGEVTPARFELRKGETQDLTIHLTNLKSVGISDADFDEPELECGTVEFDRNTGAGGLYRLTYTAEESLCTESLVFSATRGQVKVEDIQGRVEVYGSYIMQGSRQLEAVFFTMETGLEARACDVPITGPWSGELRVQPDPALASMIGLGGAFSAIAGLPGEGNRLMEMAPQLLEEGVVDVEFTIPEEGGLFPIFGGFVGYYYPDHQLVVVSISVEPLFIADISALGVCD